MGRTPIWFRARLRQGGGGQAPLISRPGRYWLVSTDNYETEVENIDWLDACRFDVSGPAAEPKWRLSSAEIPPGEEQPSGLRCRVVDPDAGLVDIEIADRRARQIYLRDDQGGHYLIRSFERADPRSEFGAMTFDPKLVPSKIRVDLFRDRAVRLSEVGGVPVPLISRPGDYRIVSAGELDGELSLAEWLGKCAVHAALVRTGE